MSAKLMPSKFHRWSNLWKLWHEWLNDNRISPVEASVRYAISFSEISKVLVGVDSVNQLKEIYKASSGTLPKIPDELQTADADLLNPSNWGAIMKVVALVQARTGSVGCHAKSFKAYLK